MAQLKEGPFGKIQGKLGAMAFRQRDGKNIIAMRPKKPYTPPQDPASIDRRSKFKFSAKLAQSILTVPDLAAIWKPATPSGMSTFNFIIQKNNKLVNPSSITDLTAITPSFGFAVSCTDESVSADSIAVTLAALGTSTGIDVSKEVNVKLTYVLSLASPANISLPDFWLLAGSSTAQPTVLNAPLVFNIPVFGQDSASIESYGEKKLLFALVTLDAENKPVKYSSTLVK